MDQLQSFEFSAALLQENDIFDQVVLCIYHCVYNCCYAPLFYKRFYSEISPPPPNQSCNLKAGSSFAPDNLLDINFKSVLHTRKCVYYNI